MSRISGTFNSCCPYCQGTIECVVEDYAEHLVDVPDECPECGTQLEEHFKLSLYDRALESVISHYTDYVYDQMRD